jgi:hypothetical protein
MELSGLRTDVTACRVATAFEVDQGHVFNGTVTLNGAGDTFWLEMKSVIGKSSVR